MSSGTFVTVEHYFNRYHYQSKQQLIDDIAQAKADLAKAHEAINHLAFANPRDLTPEGENPVYYIGEVLDDLWASYRDADRHLSALETILEGWDTKQED